MVTEKADKVKTAVDMPISLPNFVNAEVLKTWSETPARSCREALSFAASRLRAQADFMEALAGCESPMDAWKHHAEYVQGFVSEYSQEYAKALKAAQGSFTGADSRKSTA